MSSSILKISDAASIGLHAMLLLAKNSDRLLSVKEIASMLNVSANHLSKVMQRLVKHGFVESIKGYNGGFKLLSSPDQVTFLEIYELFDGKLRTSTCLLSSHECGGACILGDLVANVHKQVRDKFVSTKLSDFMK